MFTNYFHHYDNRKIKLNEISEYFEYDIANDEEIKQSIKDIYEPHKYDSIDDFITVEKEIQNAIMANIQTETETASDEENDM